MKHAVIFLGFAFFALQSLSADENPRPKLQCINGSDRPIEVFWIRQNQERVSNGRIAPGEQTTIATELGHRFAIVDTNDQSEKIIECTR